MAASNNDGPNDRRKLQAPTYAIQLRYYGTRAQMVVGNMSTDVMRVMIELCRHAMSIPLSYNMVFDTWAD